MTSLALIIAAVVVLVFIPIIYHTYHEDVPGMMLWIVGIIAVAAIGSFIFGL